MQIFVILFFLFFFFFLFFMKEWIVTTKKPVIPAGFNKFKFCTGGYKKNHFGANCKK